MPNRGLSTYLIGFLIIKRLYIRTIVVTVSEYINENFDNPMEIFNTPQQPMDLRR